MAARNYTKEIRDRLLRILNARPAVAAAVRAANKPTEGDKRRTPQPLASPDGAVETLYPRIFLPLGDHEDDMFSLPETFGDFDELDPAEVQWSPNPWQEFRLVIQHADVNPDRTSGFNAEVLAALRAGRIKLIDPAAPDPLATGLAYVKQWGPVRTTTSPENVGGAARNVSVMAFRVQCGFEKESELEV
jgi:hypothetical protein